MVSDPHQSDLLRWIPLLPLLGAAIHGLLLALIRRPLPRTAVILLSCGSVVASFLLSFWVLVELAMMPAGTRYLVDDVFTWIGSGRFSASAGFLADPLSAVMILVVTGVGALIHVYSIGYMDDDHREDRGFQRFFCYLNLFTFAMLVLVLADNLLLMFLGWEGVGLCSYLLIGFWYSDRWNAYCGSKAFIVNRIGDFGLLVGIFLLFWSLADAGQAAIAFRDVEAAFPRIAEQMVALPSWLHWLPGAPEWRLPTVIGICFFLGAAGKSAQLPLHVWLPDAMAGPTPVSALIHAATMVTAGVYLVCRMGFLYEAAPGAAALIAWVGAITAIFAATIAIAQTDIKKVLAYSTVSQLGYMFLAAGCGAYAAAMFHVVTHAFFKALLFLGSGAVILAMHHEQDTDKMGGLWRMIPRTHAVFLIGVLAIAGLPYLSAGFFSKDEILISVWLAHDTPGHLWLYAIGVITAGLTAFYMFRLHFRTFYGSFRGSGELRSRVHEPSNVVLVPLYVLAFFSVFGGYLGPSDAFVGIEDANSFGRFLAAVLPTHAHDVSHATEWKLALLATAVAFSGAALAFFLYVARPALPGRISSAIAGIHRLVSNKYYVDEVYDATVVRPTVAVSDGLLFRSMDAEVIDRTVVEGTARAVRAVAGDVLKYLQTGLAQGYLFLMVLGTLAIVAYLLR
jgi:NADH-quinone oxidoreductase subunit L